MGNQQNSDMEIWQATNARFGIWKFNRAGQPEAYAVKPNQKVSISVAERQYNDDMNRDRPNTGGGPFKNGYLMPVQLVETAEDYAEVVDNPNHLSDDDIKALLKVKQADFAERIEEMENKALLERIYEIASNTDSVTMSKMRLLEEIHYKIVNPHRDPMNDEAGKIGLSMG